MQYYNIEPWTRYEAPVFSSDNKSVDFFYSDSDTVITTTNSKEPVVGFVIKLKRDSFGVSKNEKIRVELPISFIGEQLNNALPKDKIWKVVLSLPLEKLQDELELIKAYQKENTVLVYTETRYYKHNSSYPAFTMGFSLGVVVLLAGIDAPIELGFHFPFLGGFILTVTCTLFFFGRVRLTYSKFK